MLLAMEARNTQQTLGNRTESLGIVSGGTGNTSASLPKDDAQSQRTLQFVNITGTVTLDEASRTEIRAQVMRDYHRRKKQHLVCSDSAARSANGSTSNAATTTTKTHKFKLGPRSLLPRPSVSSRPELRPKKSLAPELGSQQRLALRPHEHAQSGLLMHAAVSQNILRSSYLAQILCK
jgi:hypothetical protein